MTMTESINRTEKYGRLINNIVNEINDQRQKSLSRYELRSNTKPSLQLNDTGNDVPSLYYA